MSDHRITFITAPTEVAEHIASILVEENLAMCVNIIPQMKSIYRWEGQAEKATEALLIVKSVTESTEPMIERVKEIHPYEVPEVISVDIVAGNPDYLDWLSGKEVFIDEGDEDDEEVEDEAGEEEPEGETK